MKRSSTRSTKKGGKVSASVGMARSDDVIEQSELIKALAHPVRLSMMRLLNEARKTNTQLCANDIEKLSQPTISHHLKILREAKLVKTQHQGTWVYFSAYMPTVTVAYELIKALCE
jgi:DNA-binding transcriptional ArsR family regulator